MRMRRRGNWWQGFGERFGQYSTKLKQAITNRDTIWMHAVSVGEVNVALALLETLRERLPDRAWLMSTTTTTGMAELERKLPPDVDRIYYPIDWRSCVRRALAAFPPQAFILLEAEIWPNFLWRARASGIPTFLVNARLSERSYLGYKRFGVLFRRVFAGFDGVGAQNEEDAKRLVTLGCRPDVVRIVGSMKYDAARLDGHQAPDVPGLLRRVGVSADAPILLGGSTHDGEEEILARVYQKLRDRFPGLFLILVPRHFERSRDVARKLEALGVRFVYRKDITASTQPSADRPECLIVNTTGELRHFYKEATVVFVGKSLAAHGGQNPIEPAALAKPIVFGPNMENFGEIVRAFLSTGGAVQVQSERELETAVAELLENPQRRRELGARALKVVRTNLGAMDRTVEMIVDKLRNGDVYVAPLAGEDPAEAAPSLK